MPKVQEESYYDGVTPVRFYKMILNDDTFYLSGEPVDGSLVKVFKIPEGFKVLYAVRDEMPISPEKDADENLFLAHYHSDFWVDPKGIERDDLAEWYRCQAGQPFEDEDCPSWLDRDYYVFPVASLIHSGVWLSLGGSFAADAGGWDTSHVGAILASRKEFKTEKEAYSAAKGLLEYWNQYLSGDVYGIIEEDFDGGRCGTIQESVWGYCGGDTVKAEFAEWAKSIEERLKKGDNQEVE